MVLIVVFGTALLVAVLLSGLAARSVLSTSLLFLIGGTLVRDGVLGLVHIDAGSGIVATTADLALFAVLFTDGMHAGWKDLRSAWRLPGRALGWGLPLTLLVTALLARYVAGLDWIEALLVAADAYKRAGSTDAKALADAIRATDIKDNVSTGPGIAFDAKGQNDKLKNSGIQNRGGKLVTVAPKGATNAKAEWPMRPYDKRS